MFFAAVFVIGAIWAFRRDAALGFSFARGAAYFLFVAIIAWRL